MKFKFNVKPSDAQYIVNKDKRMVICIINNTKELFIKFVNDSLPDNDWSLIWPCSPFYNKLLMPNRFTGIAICSEDDEWSEEIGKLIAFSRAKDNLNKSFFKRAQKYIDNVDDYLIKSIEIINSLGEKLAINSKHRNDLIDQKLDGGRTK